jgi:hypothetical protein
MGVYSEYLDRDFNFPDLTAERKKQLRRIQELRGDRDILVYAADVAKPGPIQIGYDDLLPLKDQLANLSRKALDFLIETTGGSGEVAEDIVDLLRHKYKDVAIFVPGMAKSAGTIVVMSADEILMEPGSALGPIDAQLTQRGKTFSAHALLEGMKKVKREVDETKNLNRAYIPILQNISPGELQSAENALDFAKALVTDWLVQYKFRRWETHSTTGAPVKDEEKKQRAGEIAEQLCDHSRWLTHNRSIRIDDLHSMRLRVTDYSLETELADAVRRYHTLLQITFDSTSIYKHFETPDSQIYRFLVPAGAQAPTPRAADTAAINVRCHKCGTNSLVQANLGQKHPLKAGALPFPGDNKFQCPNCGAIIDLSGPRRQIEAQSKKPVIT